MRLNFALVVWGADYVLDFLDCSLPTLLGRGNIDSAETFATSRFQIFTREEDIPQFRAHPLFSRLERTIPTEFIDLGTLRGVDKYRLVSRGQAEALRLSEAFDAVLLLYPDMIWCSGGVTFALERMATGALGVFTPAPAVLPGETRKALEKYSKATRDGDVVSIPPLALAGVALRHHHPMWDSFDWDRDSFTNFPSCLRWNVGAEGWLIRCYHLHPLAIRVQPDNPFYFASFETSLDGEYVARLFSGTDRLEFVADTSEFAMVTLRQAEMPPFPRPGHRSSTVDVARWAEANAYLLHRAFGRRSVRWHDGATTEATWQEAERRADAIGKEVDARLATPDSILRYEDPVAWCARSTRRQVAHMWRRPRIAPPLSLMNQPRAKLFAVLVRKWTIAPAQHSVWLLKAGPLGHWLRRRPTAMRLWRRIKPLVTPKADIDHAVSTRSLLRDLTRRRRDGGS